MYHLSMIVRMILLSNTNVTRLNRMSFKNYVRTKQNIFLAKNNLHNTYFKHRILRHHLQV